MDSMDRKIRQQEYATKLTLMGVFASVFAGFVFRFFGQPDKREEKAFKPFDLALLGLSTLRLGRMVSYDLIFEPVRQPFTKTVPDQTGAGETVAPRQESGVRRSLGQLISCPICSGTWIAAALVYALHAIPNPTRVFLEIMGTIGVAEVLNEVLEAFSWSGQLARRLAGEKEKSK